MEVKVFENLKDLYDQVASYYIEKIKENPKMILGLATGSTPIPLYERLIKAYKRKEISFKGITTFNLDEYVGIPKTHPQSYYTFMHAHLFDHIDIDLNKVFIPLTDKEVMEKSIYFYKQVFKFVEVDLQLLGLGANGHIGFNEPKTPFDSVTHLVYLKEKTILDNARFFDSIDEVPRKAVTMGISEIMKAKEIIVIAVGESKADAVYNMVKGKVTEDVPASVLQNHPNVVLYVDTKAAQKL